MQSGSAKLKIIYQGLIKNRICLFSCVLISWVAHKMKCCIFFFLRMLFLCSLNANRSVCSNCIIHALIKYSWAIPSIHKFTWIFSTILFSFYFYSTQDATQGNIRFNRAGNQHSISYASNGKLNWLNHFSPHMSNQITIVTLRISLWNDQMYFYFNFITVILCAFIRLNRPGQ